jgi:GNAT superfamily N-acetyltransferase
MSFQIIRVAQDDDIDRLNRVAAEMSARHEDGYFQKCLQEQAQGARVIFVVCQPEDPTRLAGYVQLNWNPVYPVFRRLGIPEIQDLNVVPQARRQGLGEKLIRFCENEAASRGKKQIGISVGLHPGFGQAQRLYIRLGYVPDGFGIAYDEHTVTAGEMRAVDDFLAIKMLKTITSA